MICRLRSTLTNMSGSSIRRPGKTLVRRHIICPVNVGGLIATGVFIAAVVIFVSGTTASADQDQGSAVQTPSSTNAIAFEVASVKFNKSAELAMPARTMGRTYRAINNPLRYLIAAAYRMPADRVVGGPDWVGQASIDMRLRGGERFDIIAKLPNGTKPGQVPEMLRALLADRFKLAAHTELRDAPIFALVMARNDGRFGPKLRKAAFDCEAGGTALGMPDAAPVTGAEVKPEDQNRCQLQIGGEILGRGQRLSTLARLLSMFAERPVLDKTGLAGGFDFDLQFPELDSGPAGPRSEPASGLFSALREQLGLKLESTRGQIEFIVIDSVAHPTEN
jgi:uncharacterized protein (TIGR03435 family)